MDLGELIYIRLTGDGELSGKLAGFRKGPAVFDTEFPSDQQDGWEGRTQYPRICYRTDMQVNQERNSVGTLRVAVYTDKRSMVIDEIEDLVKRRLKDVLMKPSGQAPFCVSWSRTEPFLLEGMAVLGRELLFDIYEYPRQETEAPDPVEAVNRYIKKQMDEIFVIGRDKMDSFKEASKEEPLFYCRLESVEKRVETNTITWMDGRMAVHVICPDVFTRQKFVMALANRLSWDGKITMLDGSPMRIQKLSVNNKADYLKEGQIFITGHYGILRYQSKPKLTGVKMTGGFYGRKK